MKNILGLNENAIGDIVQAFSNSTTGIITEIRKEYGLNTGNFRNGGAWDIRFQRLSEAAERNGLEVLTRRRGIWTFNTLLDPKTGMLIVFSKKKNLDSAIKKFGNKAIHYFHALVSLCNEPQQMEFFSYLSEDYDAKRTEEAQKILQGDYSSVKQVVFVEGQEEGSKIVGVKAKLFNKYFELLDVENWTSYIRSYSYEDIFVSNETIVEDNEESALIPKIKESTKERTKTTIKTIPTKKEEKEQHKEEDNL